MATTLSIAEILRIEALLSRLEADPGDLPCRRVPPRPRHGPTGLDLPAAA